MIIQIGNTFKANHENDKEHWKGIIYTIIGLSNKSVSVKYYHTIEGYTKLKKGNLTKTHLLNHFTKIVD